MSDAATTTTTTATTPTTNATTTGFYRFGYKLSTSYIFSGSSPNNNQDCAQGGSGGRPHGLLLQSAVSSSTDFYYRRLNERFGATTNVRFLNFGFPFILEWMKTQEEAINVSEKHGHIENRFVDEIRHTVAKVWPGMLTMACTNMIEAGIAARLLRPDDTNEWRQSVVRFSDCTGRIKAHYIANILERFYLPRRWASFLFGPETTAEELAVFESRVGFGCCFEDYLKRHALFAVADLTTFTVTKVLTFLPFFRQAMARRELFVSPPAKFGSRRGAAARERPHYVWKVEDAPDPKQSLKDVATRIRTTAVDLFLGALGAACGSLMFGGGCGGAAEFWGSQVPPLILSLVLQRDRVRSSLEMLEQELAKQQNELETSMARDNKHDLDANEVEENLRNANRGLRTAAAGSEDGSEEQEVENILRRRHNNHNQNRNNNNNKRSNNSHHQHHHRNNYYAGEVQEVIDGDYDEIHQQQQNQQDFMEQLRQEEEEIAERRRYYEEGVRMLEKQREEQKQQKQKENSQSGDASKNDKMTEDEEKTDLKSPVNRHYPLSHPQRRQVVLDDDDDEDDDDVRT